MGQGALRPVLGFLNVAQMNQPEAYIQFKPELIDDAGKVTNADTETFLRDYMKAFGDFVSAHKG